MILKSQVYSDHIIEYVAYITEVSKVYILLKIWGSQVSKGKLAIYGVKGRFTLTFGKLNLFYLHAE